MNVHQKDIGASGSDWKVNMNPDDIYRTPMDIAWTFKYLMSGDKVEDLYKRAKQNQWDSDELLPWDTVVDPSKPLINDANDIYHRMPFFKKLSKSQQENGAPLPRSDRERWQVEKLAAELGVDRSTLFRWVGNREQLLETVMWSLSEPTFRGALEETTNIGAARIALAATQTQ